MSSKCSQRSDVTNYLCCVEEKAFAIMPSPMRVRAGVAQLVRVPACHAGGRGFKSRRPRHFVFAAVAQLVEQWTENPCVAGSIPACGTIFNKCMRELLQFPYLKPLRN